MSECGEKLPYRILNNFSEFPRNSTDPHTQLFEEICKTREVNPNDWKEFIHPEPLIQNPIGDLSAYKPFKNKLEEIKGDPSKFPKILIYGDYDCDGITSSVIMHDLLLALGVDEMNICHFIPDRFADGYGLTENGWDSAKEAHGEPNLLITVDCGTPSGKLIEGFDFPTLVIDHHDFDDDVNGHPAAAHLNPKAEDSPEAKSLQSCCAAGLAFLLAEEVVEDLSIEEKWNRDRALILGGLGTMVDVMRLVGVNRAMVKHSMRLANLSTLAENVPGLAALKTSAKTTRVDRDAYGFQWGPRINACGRLMEASPALNLLLATNEASAIEISQQIEDYFEVLKGGDLTQTEAAGALSAMNEERKSVQREVLEEALEQAETLLELTPKPKVLVLYNEKWHAGVIGIVAARVREAYHRPAIVLGKQPDPNGPWKGSGRSIPEYNLGTGIRAAATEGILLGGGGHPMAAGMSAESEDKIKELQDFMNNHCTLEEAIFTPAYEILGVVGGKKENEWWKILQHLEPFGQGNPQLYFNFTDAVLNEKKDIGETGSFTLLTFQNGSTTFNVGTDPDTAELLNVQTSYDGVVSLSQKAKNASRIYYNWRLEDWKATS